MTTGTIMLSLISEQAIPNVMAALLVEPRPAVMVCLLPEDRDRPGEPDQEYRRVYEGIRAAFAALVKDTGGEIDLRLQARGPVSPYDFPGVKDVCRSIREEFAAREDTLIYNVTGGTKLMAQAALEDAKAGNCRVIYVDTEFRNLVEVWPVPGKSEFVEERLRPLDVPHYLAAYGLGQRRVQGRDSVPENFKQAACLLATSPEQGAAILKLILGNKGRKNVPYPPLSVAGLGPDQRDLLEQVVDSLGSGYASVLPQSDTLELSVDDDMYAFWWDRRWLEWYVFSVLEQLIQTAGEGLRYNKVWSDVRFVWDTDHARQVMKDLLVVEDEAGQSIPLPLNELDVTAARGGRLLVCECKTGKLALRSEHFYKLSVIGRRLGTFADKVFVTDVPGLANPLCDNAHVRRQAVRALTLDVAVVGLEQLPRLGEILAEPDRILRRQKNQFGLR